MNKPDPIILTKSYIPLKNKGPRDENPLGSQDNWLTNQFHEANIRPSKYP